MDGSLIIDHDMFIAALISVFGALLSFTVAFLFMSIRYLINSFDKKLESCSKNISEKIGVLMKYAEDNKKAIDHAHNRVSNHVEKHHTK